MKKKVLIIVSIFIILIGYISYIYFNRKKDNLNSLSSGIAMYVYNETTNSYVASSSIPTGSYELNTSLTHCVAGSNISGYNASAGTINYALNGADWCYIYFEYEKEPPVISNLTASGGTVTATLTDNAQLGSYIVSTSATAPSSGYTEISGASYNLIYKATSAGTYYIYVKDSVGNITKSSNFSLTIPATTTLINLGVMTTDAHTVSGTTYTNYRFTGANPNNYACLSSNGTSCINYTKGSSSSTNTTGGLFRIIGVFDEDTHGQSGEQLVKLITADTLGGSTLSWDYKKGSTSVATASSVNSNGSNDWSDSQLMYMLNGSAGNNKGYQSLTPVYGTTTPIRTLTYSSNIVYYNSTNYFYKNYSGYSYLSGSTTSSRTLNKPASVANGSNYSSSSTNQVTVNSLVPSQTSMIKEVTWHLGGYSSDEILTSALYTYERGTETCYSTGNCSTTTRPTTWIGKIGLMYPSDYGYATSGGTTYNRNACLTSYNLYRWSTYGDCYKNDWLLYPKSRTGTKGTATGQWTISPSSSDNYAVWRVYSTGAVLHDHAAYYSILAARPAFYLESDVSLAGGSGTSTDPYLFVRN